MAYWFSVDGEIIDTDERVMQVGDLRQEIAMKSDLGQHIFSRALIHKGEVLANNHRTLLVHEQAFLTRR